MAAAACHGVKDGIPFGTDGKTVRCIFHVASRIDCTVFSQKSCPYTEMGVWGIGPFLYVPWSFHRPSEFLSFAHIPQTLEDKFLFFAHFGFVIRFHVIVSQDVEHAVDGEVRQFPFERMAVFFGLFLHFFQ